MRCEECGALATGDARGWEAHRVEADDEDDRVLLFFCPACVDREFSWQPDDGA